MIAVISDRQIDLGGAGSEQDDKSMKWNILAFLGFVILSSVGAGVAFLFLFEMGRRFGRELVQRHSQHGLLIHSGFLVSAIFMGAIASALVSLLPLAFAPQTLGQSTGVLGQIHWPYVAAFAFMLLGMTASYFNKLINERRTRINELRKEGDFTKPNIDFDVWDFVQPFLVAVITFGAVIARASETEPWTNILIGFQTGFFWQTILSNRVPIQNQGNASARSST